MGREQQSIVDHHQIRRKKGIYYFSNTYLGIKNQQIYRHWAISENPEEVIPISLNWHNHPANGIRGWNIGCTQSTLTYVEYRKIAGEDGEVDYVGIPHPLFGGRNLVVLEGKAGRKITEIAPKFLVQEDGDIGSDQSWLSPWKIPTIWETLFSKNGLRSFFQMPSPPWFS